MGWGSIKRSVRKAGRQIESGARKTYHEYDRYTSSKTGAYLTPWLSYYDSDGRRALREAYGNYAVAGAGTVNPAAGAVAGAALNTYDAYQNRNAGGAFTPAAAPAPVAETPAEARGFPWEIVGGAVAAIAVAGVVVLVVRKGAR